MRKTLYDLWDNMFRIVALNIGFLLILGIPIFLPALISKVMIFFGLRPPGLEMVLTGVGILISAVYLSTASYTLRNISDYGTFGFADFFGNIKHAWKAGLVMGLAAFILFLVPTLIMPFYLEFNNIIGLLLAATLFWVTLFGMVSFQFYFAVYTRLGGKIGKSLKKCMILSLDNTGYAFFLFIHNLIVIYLSVRFSFMMFLLIVPGPAGMLLYIDQALRLRLFKYDWLEANPGANRKKIPWEELLVEERERVGHRTFKNFIFPWKD